MPDTPTKVVEETGKTMAAQKFITVRATEPPLLDDSESFDLYMKRLKMWRITGGVERDRQGGLVVQTLSNKSKFKVGLADKLLELHSVEDLVGEKGIDLVQEFLEKELGKKKIDKLLETWKTFEYTQRKSGEDVTTFISRFEMEYARVKAAWVFKPGYKMPEAIIASMLLMRVKASETQEMIIRSKVDLEKETVFDDMVAEIKSAMSSGCSKRQGDQGLALEATLKDGEASVFLINGEEYEPRKKKERFDNRERDKDGKLLNRKGPDGKRMTCFKCGSELHFSKGCPNRKQRDESIHFCEQIEVDEADYIILAASEGELSAFTWEARGSAALDSCCSSTVAGNNWFEIYMEELSEEEKKVVEGPFESGKVFRFGNDGKLESLGQYKIPAKIIGQPVMITTDIVSSDIPMLLSKKAMKAAKIKLDFAMDEVEAFGKKIPIRCSSSGHPLLDLQEGGIKEHMEISVEEIQVLLVSFETDSEADKVKGLVKIHKQFGHQPEEKFISLLKNAGVWKEDMKGHLEKIMTGCVGCLQRRRNPDRPAVALPMASEFNQLIAVDLKILYEGEKKLYILHIIDMWSRYTISTFIPRKRARDAVDGMAEKWIAYFGSPGGILSDNGGEFTAEEVREFKSLFNMRDLTTGAEAPWMNGCAEKNHAVVDVILARLREDYPMYSKETNMAKNSLSNVYGFSPNQLVFGSNPRLPNVFQAGLPELEGRTMSETIKKHFDLLHAARKEFIKSEASKKVKIALMKKVRTNNTVYYPGDEVWYKRTDEDKWRGPGKVIFQDGKVLCVRNGFTNCLIQLSVNRVCRLGEEYPALDSEEKASDEVSDSTGEEHSKESNDSPSVRFGNNFITERILGNNTPASAPALDEENPASVPGLGEENPAFVPVLGEENPAYIPVLGDENPASASALGEDNPASWLQPEGSTIPSPSSQGGLGEEGGWVGTTTPSGPSPLRGSGVPQDIDRDYVGDENPGEVLDEPSIGVRTSKRSREDEACQDQPAPKRKDNHQTKVPNTKPKISLEKGDRLMIKWEGEDITATVLGRGGKTTGKTYNYFNLEMANTLQCCMNMEEVEWRRLNLEECNMVLVPRERHKEFQVREAKRKELGKLNDWNAVETIDDVGQFRISCTWVVWMKPQDEGDPECRARLVARGYEEEYEVPSDSPTVDKASIRLILMICAARKWVVRTSDVKSAFLQGRELDRHVVMKPPREAGIPKGKLWKLRVALYGLDDASLRFYQKVAATFKELDLQQSKLDPALFYKLDKDGVLQGIVGTHVDDFLHCGNQEF